MRFFLHCQYLRRRCRFRNLWRSIIFFCFKAFGDGSVAQSVLSGGTLGLAQSIHWSWGIGVTLGIYVGGGVSGAHMNPAVSVAQACVGNLPWKKVPVYMIAQYCGAFLASLFVYLVYYGKSLSH